MPRDKKIVVGLELNDKEFLRGLSEINKTVQDVGRAVSQMTKETGSNFATLSTSINTANHSIQSGNQTLTEMKNVLVDVRNVLNTLSGGVSSINSTLSTMNQTANQTGSTINSVASSVGSVSGQMNTYKGAVTQTNTAAQTLNNTNMQAVQSFNAINNAANNASNQGLENLQNAYSEFSQSANRVFGGFGKNGAIGQFMDIFNPARAMKAAGWNMAYKIANAPGQAFQSIVQGADAAIKSSSQLEGTMYDLQAYLGGPMQDEFQNLAKEMGKTGTAEQLNDQGMQALQNKILQIGQTTAFTANQIAEATVAAAKAGVSLKEIAGEGGKALDAISYLSQNTGESLENSATQVSKLQALFEANLNRTQESFGKVANAGEQYQIIVDGLSAADMSSAASAQQLTEALFNVGGSASNLNISFFETMSLVSQMVPAFESAASAGTSLKYVFSGISGGRSVKAKAAMKQFGLMDEFGQSVFFGMNEKTGKTEFKGIEFMTKQLREVFGDNSGMAVDVRNRIITDIFGQDALKAVSRLVSMTDDQANQMYKMAADMTANAQSGVQSAAKLAEIKNEGLEFDLEFLKGTLDSLQKTMTMPLMKPMSNIVQTFSGIGNAAFAVMSDAKDVKKQIDETQKEFIDTSLLPGAKELMDTAIKFGATLRDVLKTITSEGYNINSVSKALATLFGGTQQQITTRTAEFKDLLTRAYAGFERFIKALPSLLEQVAVIGLKGFDVLIRSLTWISENWETVVTGLKAVIAVIVVGKVLDFASAIGALALNFQNLIVAGNGAGNLLANFALMQGGGAGGLSQLIQSLAIRGGIGQSLAAAGGAAATAGAPLTAAAANSIPILTTLMNLWTSFTSILGSVWATISTTTGWMTMLQGVISAILSPLGLLVVAVVAFYVAWTNNTLGMADFITEKFGFMFEYITATFSQIGAVLLPAWQWICDMFSSLTKTTFMDGVANIFKSLVTIMEGSMLVIGGILKSFFGLIQGIFTGNWDLLKSGGMDLMLGIGQILKGVAGTIVGAVQTTINGIIDAINAVGGKLGLGRIQSIGGDVNRNLDKSLKEGGVQSGKNFADGLSEGMNSGNKKVAKSAYDLIKVHGLEVVDNTQDAHSRSEETYQDGINFGDGLAQGIESRQGAVRAAASGLASAALSTVDEKFEQAYRGGKTRLFDGITGTYANIYASQAASTTRTTETQTLTNAEVIKSIVNGTYVLPKTKNLGRDMNFGAGAAGYVYQANATQQAVSNYKTTDFDEKYIVDLLVNSSQFWSKYDATGSLPHTADTVKSIINERSLQLAHSNFYDRADIIISNMMAESGSSGFFSGLTKDKKFDVSQWYQSNDFVNAQRNVRDMSVYGNMSIDQLNKRRYMDVYGTRMSDLNNPGIKMITNTFKKGIQDPYFLARQLRYQKTSTTYDKEAQRLLTGIRESTGDLATDFSLRYFDEGSGLYAGAGMYKTTQVGPISYLRQDQYNPEQIKIREAMRQGKYDAKLGVIVESLGDYKTSLKKIAETGPATAAALGNIASTLRANATYAGTVQNFKNGMPTEHLDQLTGLPIPATTTRETKSYNWDPYNYGEWITRGMSGQINAPVNAGLVETSYTKRKLTAPEMQKNIKPLDFVPVTQLPQAASFFSDQIIPEQYDSTGQVVSTDVAAYKKLYGASGVEFRGLTQFFEDNQALSDQYAQVGNRAATFLSLHQGVLSAEDYKTFIDLMNKDKADKEAYLKAAKTLKTEQDKIRNDPTLTAQQKQTKLNQLTTDFSYNQSSLAGSYRDVLGVKVGGMSDYKSLVDSNEVSAQAKPYTDVAFQRVNEAFANAVNPANLTEKFKSLTPEQQDALKKAVQEMPLETMAYYNSAMADGVITDSERILLEQYSQEDAKRISDIIAGGVMPTQEQLDAAFKPYVEGTATLTSAENITGVMAPAWLSGMSNIATAAGIVNGNDYLAGFTQGLTKDKDGKDVSLGAVTVLDALKADPAAIAQNGVIAGESLPEGIWQGIAAGSEELEYKVTKYFGPADKSGKRNLIKVVYEAIKKGSPSRLYRDEVGQPIIAGVAKGILNNAFLVEEAMKKVLGFGSGLIQAGQSATPPTPGMPPIPATPNPAEPTTTSPFFLMGQNASKDFVKGFVNADDPVNAFSVALMTAIGKPFNPESTDQSVLDMLLKVVDFGKKIAHVLIDEGFAYVIDGKADNSWTFATTVGNALAITAVDEGNKWRPQAISLGKNISYGIADGIADSAAVQKIIDNAVLAVKAALVAATDEAKVNSPSLLFAEKVGSPITEGIAHGITESSYLLDSAMGGLMAGATRNYRPDISPVALAGQRQAEINAQNTYNYNLGVHTSQNPQLVERSFAVMQSFKGQS